VREGGRLVLILDYVGFVGAEKDVDGERRRNTLHSFRIIAPIRSLPVARAMNVKDVRLCMQACY
jgi:hypothetical protein